MTEPSRSPLRTVGLLRAVIRRSRADWPLVLATWLLLACSTVLITSAVTYSESVTLGGFHRMIEASAPAASAVRIHASIQGTGLAAADAAIAPAIRTGLGDGRGLVALVATTDSLSLAGVDASDATRQIRVGSYDKIETHSSLSHGRWPKVGGVPVEATLSTGAAAALGFKTGDRIVLTSKLDPARRIDVVIVGLWQPNPDDRYWLGSGLELTGVQSDGRATTRGPFVVTPADLTTMAATTSVNAEWRWLPAIDALNPADADPLRDAIAGLGDRVAAAYPAAYTYSESGLPDTLAAATKALIVAQSSALLLFTQFAIVAVYAILLVAGMLVERRRPESALLRSRGAGSIHLALLALGEATLLAVPAVAVAPFAAQGVLRLMGAVGPLATAGVLAPVGIDGAAITAAVVAGLGCIVVLTLPALPRTVTLSGVRAALSRQVGRTLAQRLGLDLVLVAVAAVAVWQLRMYGAPLTRTVRGSLGIDPLLVAAPAIGLLAGALVATRIVPRLGELAERLAERGSGLTATFLARQIGRRPLRYTRLALLLMLAASLGTFAAMFSATWSRSQSDQAAYQSAADVRVTLADHPALPDWARGPAYAAIAGVRTASPASRTTADVGRDVIGGQMLAIDSAAVAELSSFPGGSLGESPAATLKLLSAPGAGPMIALPGQPERLAVTIDTNLVVPGLDTSQTDPASPTTEIEVSVVVADGTGLHRFAGRSIGLKADGSRVIIAMTATIDGRPYRMSGPLRLEAVEIKLVGQVFSMATGTVQLRSLESSDSTGGDQWQTVDLGLGSAGWGWGRVFNQTATVYSPPPGSPGLVSIGLGDTDVQSGDGVTIRYWAAPGGSNSIPALANRQLLDAGGALEGDTILASRLGFESPLTIVATVDGFPTLDPSKPLLVVDGAALGLIDYATWGLVDTPGEWWLTVSPGSESAVVTALSGGPYSVASIVSRAQIEASQSVDPVSLAVIGALLLGSLAAALIAAIGFLVTVAFMARERRGELALLRALGQTSRSVVAMLAAEEVGLLAYGLLAGVGLGLLIGWLSIPFASLTPSGLAAIPPPVLVVPWPTICVLAIPGLALLALGATVLIRISAAGPVAGALRSREVEP
jgi:hypothetical protein